MCSRAHRRALGCERTFAFRLAGFPWARSGRVSEVGRGALRQGDESRTTPAFAQGTARRLPYLLSSRTARPPRLTRSARYALLQDRGGLGYPLLCLRPHGKSARKGACIGPFGFEAEAIQQFSIASAGRAPDRNAGAWATGLRARFARSASRYLKKGGITAQTQLSSAPWVVWFDRAASRRPRRNVAVRHPQVTTMLHSFAVEGAHLAAASGSLVNRWRMSRIHAGRSWSIMATNMRPEDGFPIRPRC